MISHSAKPFSSGESPAARMTQRPMRKPQACGSGPQRILGLGKIRPFRGRGRSHRLKRRKVQKRVPTRTARQGSVRSASDECSILAVSLFVPGASRGTGAEPWIRRALHNGRSSHRKKSRDRRRFRNARKFKPASNDVRRRSGMAWNGNDNYRATEYEPNCCSLLHYSIS